MRNFQSNTHSLEDALLHIPYGKFHIFLTIICGFSAMGMVMENVNVSLIISYVKCDLPMTTSEQGLLNSVSFIGIVVSSHFWGFLADTWGRRNVMRISLLGGFIFAFISAFSATVTFLICTRLIVGMLLSGVQAATYSYVMEFHKASQRNVAVSFVTIFQPAIFIFLPVTAWIIIPMNWEIMIYGLLFKPWRLFLICNSLLNVVNFVCISLLPESPKFLISMDRKEETLDVLRNIYKMNSGDRNEIFPVHRLESEVTGRNISDVTGIGGMLELVWNQTWPLFVKPHLGTTLKLCYLMFILFSIGHGTLMWFPDFLSQLELHMDEGLTLCEVLNVPKLASNITDGIEVVSTNCSIDNTKNLTFQILFGVGIFFMAFSAIISFFIDQIGSKLLMNIWLPLCAIACLGIVWLTNFYLIVIMFMTYLSGGLCAAILSAISVDLFPSNIRAMATCVILMFGRIGSAYGSNIVGLFLNSNCQYFYYINFIEILSCLVVFYFLVCKPTTPKF